MSALLGVPSLALVFAFVAWQIWPERRSWERTRADIAGLPELHDPDERNG